MSKCRIKGRNSLSSSPHYVSDSIHTIKEDLDKLEISNDSPSNEGSFWKESIPGTPITPSTKWKGTPRPPKTVIGTVVPENIVNFKQPLKNSSPLAEIREKLNSLEKRIEFIEIRLDDLSP